MTSKFDEQMKNPDFVAALADIRRMERDAERARRDELDKALTEMGALTNDYQK